ncbi:translocation protein Sec62-domain-containing protein [Dipodascopsis tothii]|uniref:translocation protein Sec62-domain-containing protein n=1 Tax=Dipodascopsis tothii TaxID=44089 RepID=UPI0034CF0E9F
MSQQQNQQLPADALAIAGFLRHSRYLKQRQGILNGKRHDFFRVKRALRALESKEYKLAQAKSSVLPAVESTEDAVRAFQRLPMASLAIRVEKLTRKSVEAKLRENAKAQVPPLEALSKTKGVPTLQFVREQLVADVDDVYYVWLWEKVQWTTYLYSVLFLIAIFGVILFPLWPQKLRLGVWYLSMAVLGLIAAFFAMAVVRLVLFCVTYVVANPGIWLFPNLFEDVGFVDSFIPLWAWDMPPEKKKKAKKVQAEAAAATAAAAPAEEADEADE